MQSFFVTVVVKAILALLQNDEFQQWLQKQKDELKAELKQDLADLEQKVIGLPGEIIGEGFHDLTHAADWLKDEIPPQVKGEVEPLFDILNPADLAQKIIGGMVGQGGQKPPWWPF